MARLQNSNVKDPQAALQGVEIRRFPQNVEAVSNLSCKNIILCLKSRFTDIL